MSEISEEATRLIDEFEYAAEDAVSDYMMPGGASYKNQVRYNLEDYIAELEAENEKINYFFRRLRMFCIFAHWDNPDTEAEFYKVDAEIREYLSEYKVCIDPEVQE
jgi:hypothetical protein